MKVLITEEQLKLIINEQNPDDAKLSRAEKNILQNYIPISKEQIAAYEELRQYAENKGINVKQKDEFKNYPFNNDHMKKLLDKGVTFQQDVQPYDYHELVSGVISHNQAINKDAEGAWLGGKRKFLNTPIDYDYSGGRLRKNDLEIEELANLKKLIDVVADLKDLFGIPIDRITAGDDMYHRKSHGLHTRAKAIDFTLKTSNDDIQKKMEEAIAFLITTDPDLRNNFSFINEYYTKTKDGTGPHIHMGYGGDSNVFYRWLKDKNGKRIGNWESHTVANKKIKESPIYWRGYELMTNDDEPVVRTTKAPPLGSVKIKGNNLIIDMGGTASKLGFRLYKIDNYFTPTQNKEVEVEFKKSSGTTSKAGVSKTSAAGIRSFNIPKLTSDQPILIGVPLFFKVCRVMDGRLVEDTTMQTENFIFDKDENILTGYNMDSYTEKCKPTFTRIVSPMTLVTPLNPNGIPYGDWDWCDAKTKGDSYMGATIYVDSKGREVVVKQ